MMLQVNKDALEFRINSAVEDAIQKISENAQSGLSVTDISFETEIFKACRKKLNEYMTENNVNFCWLDIGGLKSLDYGTHRMGRFKLKQ